MSSNTFETCYLVPLFRCQVLCCRTINFLFFCIIFHKREGHLVTYTSHICKTWHKALQENCLPWRVGGHLCAYSCRKFKAEGRTSVLSFIVLTNRRKPWRLMFLLARQQGREMLRSYFTESARTQEAIVMLFAYILNMKLALK